jgi:hypothetical protein
MMPSIAAAFSKGTRQACANKGMRFSQLLPSALSAAPALLLRLLLLFAAYKAALQLFFTFHCRRC